MESEINLHSICKLSLQSYLDSSGLVLLEKYPPTPTRENLLYTLGKNEIDIVHLALANAQRGAGHG